MNTTAIFLLSLDKMLSVIMRAKRTHVVFFTTIYNVNGLGLKMNF